MIENFYGTVISEDFPNLGLNDNSIAREDIIAAIEKFQVENGESVHVVCRAGIVISGNRVSYPPVITAYTCMHRASLRGCRVQQDRCPLHFNNIVAITIIPVYILERSG